MSHRYIQVLSAIFILCSSAFAQESKLPPLKHQFDDYPASQVKVEHKAILTIPPEAKEEEAQIAAAYYKRPIDYGGRYVFIPLPCGAGCEGGGIVDAVSGKAFPLPGGVSDPPGLPDYSFERIAYRKSSLLMVLVGNINERETNPGKLVRRYYLFDESRFRLLDEEVLFYNNSADRWLPLN